MTLEQLRIFVGVAELEHVTAAARMFNITQSTASAAIAALEERHGVKLFHRVGRNIVLTEEGQVFLEEARRVLAQARSAEAVLDELNGLKRGTLRVVASQTIAAYWLPAPLSAFRRQFPGVTVDLKIGNTEQVAAHIREGQSDLGFIEGEIRDPLLVQWAVGEDRLHLVQAGVFKTRTVSATWLEKAPWIMRERGSGTRSCTDDCLRKIGVRPENLEEFLVLPSNESVRTAVEAGFGIAALSSLVVAPAVTAGTLHIIPADLGTRTFFGLQHKERSPGKAATAFLSQIEKTL